MPNAPLTFEADPTQYANATDPVCGMQVQRASVIMMLGYALTIAIESTDRLINPVTIAFDQTVTVAIVGLAVNGFSAWVLMSTPHEHGHSHAHHHVKDYDHHGHDHNLRAAYLHVLADALTSIFAIVALLAGKYMGASWLDPAMCIVGAALVTRWSCGLIREAGKVLLDNQADKHYLDNLRVAIEGENVRLCYGLAHVEHRSWDICRRDRCR